MRVTVQMNAELRDALRAWQEALRNLEKGATTFKWGGRELTPEERQKKAYLDHKERAAYQRVAALLDGWD